MSPADILNEKFHGVPARRTPSPLSAGRQASVVGESPSKFNPSPAPSVSSTDGHGSLGNSFGNFSSAGKPPLPRGEVLSPSDARVLHAAFDGWTQSVGNRNGSEGGAKSEHDEQHNPLYGKVGHGQLSPLTPSGQTSQRAGLSHLVMRELIDAEEALWAPDSASSPAPTSPAHSHSSRAVSSAAQRSSQGSVRALRAPQQGYVPTPANLSSEGKTRWEGARDACTFRVEKLVDAACDRHARRVANVGWSNRANAGHAATAELRSCLRAMKKLDMERQRALLRRAGVAPTDYLGPDSAGSMMDLAIDDAQLALLRPGEMTPRELHRFRKTYSDLKSARAAEIRRGAKPHGPLELADLFAERRAELWAEAHTLIRELEMSVPEGPSLKLAEATTSVPAAVLLTLLGAAGGAVALRDEERRTWAADQLSQAGDAVRVLWSRAMSAARRRFRTRVDSPLLEMPPNGLPRNGTREYRKKNLAPSPSSSPGKSEMLPPNASR